MKAKEQIVAMTKNKGHTIKINGVNFSRHLVKNPNIPSNAFLKVD